MLLIKDYIVFSEHRKGLVYVFNDEIKDVICRGYEEKP